MKLGVIALLGSGETGPSMTKVHRQLFSTLDEVRAVALDTSYAFQANVPQMTEKIVEYFATSLNREITPLHFADHTTASAVEAAIFRQRIREANYVFSGPGSPSYALRQWSAIGAGSELESVVQSGGVLCFASAAALTLGAFTAPIYEIYKAGATGHWLDGLDVLALAGLKCAVIPHFDNAEGGNYDTRYCYLGEDRLARLETELPADAGILGIDEHTAAIIDLAEGTIAVIGRANAYWRRGGEIRVLANGSTTQLSEIQSFIPTPEAPRTPIKETMGTVEALANAASQGGPQGLEAIAELARLASNAHQDYIDASPVIDELLELRNEARVRKDFDLSDQLRNLLVRLEVEVMDGPNGSTWRREPH